MTRTIDATETRLQRSTASADRFMWSWTAIGAGFIAAAAMMTASVNALAEEPAIRGDDGRPVVSERRPAIYLDGNLDNERWPSNYRPDGYSLDDYDGEAESATLCRGASGMTLSTRAVECPPGQEASEASRQLSTSP